MQPLAPIALAAALVLPCSARAQTGVIDEPIGRFTIDLQGSLARLPRDEASAAGLATSAASLPSSALGGRFAATWYPLRLGAVTFGLGGSLAVARGASAPFETRFLSAAPQLSFNFGHRRGWSYISGGIATSRLTIAREGTSGGPRAQTIDYGGGARWFVRDHLAVSFDLRFYAISPTAAETGFPARGRTTMLVFSAGVSVK